MTRQKCETLIREQMRVIWDIYKQYNPNGNYLSMSIINGGCTVNNSPWDDENDKKNPIDLYFTLGEELNE